ncbi:MAG TPA: endolytic transglycosylase MltG [Acidobacteriota bacterium]|nr:endolytic transglycosylase MltG [Acidobacteriota bacterium]HMZ82046.1 endolytic transglycosylase MltG [Acidobacteriota bacterium]HND20259.1 endolytic transglycosylase MltG [Acidobacteriota bacterium]HNG92171.1 endolytic transglycosylase MltG [Acidobacteriota bacterium]HNH80869.1 endolytic transglycosylase MltG [Acidobacteriota bacterium]
MTNKSLLARFRPVLIGLGLICALCGGFAYWVYHSLTTPLTHQAADRIIEIESGMGTRGILVRLWQEGVISSRFPLLVYLTVNRNQRPLQAGEYQFESPITPLKVIEKIQRGQVITHELTIPEGLNIFEVENLLKNRDSATPVNGQAVVAELRNITLIRDLDPTASTLEGYLFPDTYVYARNTTSAQLVTQMVRRFRDVFTPQFQARARELGMSVRQVVTLASLIEKEGKVDEDRALISSVFHNRLKRGMKLDCDPTFMYAAMLDGTWDGNVNNPQHRRSLSPYNTYLAPGLPPGPIASPGAKSIQAALYPAESEYIYFVLNEGGKHRFSRTDAEHAAAVAEYRRLQGRR